MRHQKNSLLAWGALLLFFLISNSGAFALSFLPPPDEKTGAPNEGTCADCHIGNALNVAGGLLVLKTPEIYEPGEVYSIIVDLSRTGQSVWGFEMTALDANGDRVGSFTADTAANTEVAETADRQYIKHTTAGTARGTNNAHSWEFKWTAPDADIGPVHFYAAGNAGNGDFGVTGDYIYTAQTEAAPVAPIVAGVSLEVVGDSVGTTMDAIAGVDYTLKITNTGNMTDKITLSTSAEIGIEGSVLGALSERSLELEAGGAAEVTLTVSGDAFAKPGEYVIGVTATSETDTTMKSTITTTTTIEVPAPEPTPEPPPTPGDVNDDGIVDIRDLVLVAGQLGQSGEGLKADMNGDGKVDILDLVTVSSHFGK